MGKRRLLIPLILLSWRSLGAEAVDDPFALIDVFGSRAAHIERLIYGYSEALRKDPADRLSMLSLAMLHVALGSREIGEDEHARAALEYAEDYLALEPAGDLGLLFCGVAHALRAGNSKNPLTRMFQMKKAVSRLDKAAEAAAGTAREWYVRFMRANTYASTPRSMGKWAQAEEDYRFLFRFIENDLVREPYLVAALYYRAVMLRAAGDRDAARECLRRSLAVEERYRTGMDEADRAANLLGELEGDGE